MLEATWRRNENDLTRAGHMAICQALRDRDEDAAAAAVYEHLALTGAYRECLPMPLVSAASSIVIPILIAFIVLFSFLKYSKCNFGIIIILILPSLVNLFCNLLRIIFNIFRK